MKEIGKNGDEKLRILTRRRVSFFFFVSFCTALMALGATESFLSIPYRKTKSSRRL